MKRTIFILGRTPSLAILELQSLYPAISLIATGVAVTPHELNARESIDLLGGTVKIAEEVSEVPDINAGVLFAVLLPYARDGKIAFGLSGYGNVKLPMSIFVAVKKLFVSRGINARYVQSQHTNALGSVVIAKQRLTEILVIGFGAKYLLGITRAVQNFEDWNTRDSARPAPDPRRGMLPPKVARMIVNIALRPSDSTQTLLDPFCGVGTVLGEALLLGVRVIGFDISLAAVAKAQKNIAWLRAHYGLLQREAVRIDMGDATHVSEYVPSNSIDAIVTEPLLGEQIHVLEGRQPPADRVKNIIKGLEKLYTGCLKEWTKVLKPGSRVVMAVPSYVTDRGILTVKKVVDRCEILGYTLLTGPIEYSRPQATVRREFYIFQKK